MKNDLRAFQIRKDGKILDYRFGKNLNLQDVSTFFGKKGYIVKRIENAKRHIIGVLEKNGQKLFVKVSMSEGISYLTENEAKWDRKFNEQVPKTSIFRVPQLIDEGYFQTNLFFLVTDCFDGEFFADRDNDNIKEIFKKQINNFIDLTELIQSLKLDDLRNHEFQDEPDHAKWFVRKTLAWYNDTPKEIREKYRVDDLLKIVEKGAPRLQKRSRHGDFTPWHTMLFADGKIGLIDGEHAMGKGVEYYDICYLIQRVFAVQKQPEFAKEIFNLIKKRGYNLQSVKTVLAARAIGGFLDAHLKVSPTDYENANKFMSFVLSL